MKFKLLLFLSVWMLALVVSCNKDEITFDEPSQELRFSKDTVFCDTVYHQVRSETYVVKVFNDDDKDIMIPRINLEKGASSLYKINVDGKSGHDFKNVPLRKKDSLYIFVEIAPEASGPEAIAEDRVVFTSSAGQQHVTLFSVVQDAEFFIQSSTNPNVINNHTTWTANKAKIIYGDLTINPNVSLDVEPGTKIYFHKNSGMKVLAGGTLNLNGTKDNQVIIRGDRNDTYYDTIPRNWNSIRLEAANLNMNHTRLYGGYSGLEMKESNATIKNSFIHTFEDFGINAIASRVDASNLVMNNCGEAAIGIYKGGNHKYTHCTIANYSDLLSSRNRVGIFASNGWKNESGQTEVGALQQLSILNSIVYSDRDNSVYFEAITGQQFEYYIKNSLIKYSNAGDAGFPFENNAISVIQSIKNEDPKFVNYFAAQMNLRVKADSPAKAKGDATIASTVPTDIVNNSRTSSPTLGAYQLQ